jgi:hypothetical protein
MMIQDSSGLIGFTKNINNNIDNYTIGRNKIEDGTANYVLYYDSATLHLKQGLLTTSNISSISGSIIGTNTINNGPLNTDVNSFAKVTGGYASMTGYSYLLETSSSVYAYTASLMYKTVYAGMGFGFGT